MGNDLKSKESYCLERGHPASQVQDFISEIRIRNSLQKNYFKYTSGIIYTNTYIGFEGILGNLIKNQE